jgi:HEAT repeats
MRLIGLCSLASFLMLPTITGMAQASGTPARVAEVEEAIAAVRSDKTVDARTNAAEHLASLTKKISAKEATEKLVIDVMSLLDSSDDSVRFWVARALGNLGPIAKAAIPKLEEMLPKADCMNGAITSANGIRYALIQMGVKPPPPPKCQKIAG